MIKLKQTESKREDSGNYLYQHVAVEGIIDTGLFS